MRVTVIGQKPGGPVVKRTVTAQEFVEGWGVYAGLLWRSAWLNKTVTIDGHLIRVVAHR